MIDKPVFTAHNILVESGYETFGGHPLLCNTDLCISVINTLNAFFSYSERSKIEIADLGCLEGGYSVEFARNGYNVTGIEVREANYQNCLFVKQNLQLENLNFILDDVRNLSNYSNFDVIFCSGLLYHLEYPVSFLQMMAKKTNSMLILNTHYANETDTLYDFNNIRKRLFTYFFPTITDLHPLNKNNFNLSKLSINEGKKGRWFYEFPEDKNYEELSWASYRNSKSFWLTKEELVQSIFESGFPVVYEQFDSDKINNLSHFRKINDRSTFIALKNKNKTF